MTGVQTCALPISSDGLSLIASSIAVISDVNIEVKSGSIPVLTMVLFSSTTANALPLAVLEPSQYQIM